MSTAYQLRRLDAARSCAHKHAHASYGKALAQIRSIAARFGETAAHGLTAYRCRFCVFYHVGHIHRGRGQQGADPVGGSK